MTDMDTGKFARRAQHILDRDHPKSLADLLGDAPSASVNTESRETVQQPMPREGTAGQTVREEFRFPRALAEMLREYAHQHRQKKTNVVIEALEEFFHQHHFSLPER